MKLVIDIDDELYKAIRDCESPQILSHFAIKNGTLYKERPHGEWEKYGYETEAYDIQGNVSWGQKRKCTNCGFIHTYIEDFGFYSFCPSCGADMRMKEGELK